MQIHVICCNSRPHPQGKRITSGELLALQGREGQELKPLTTRHK